MPPDARDVPDAGEDLGTRAWLDVHRPRFHVVAPGGWMNDPNGLGCWDGTYHLFYQYNPARPVHDDIHWGHATSRDLLTWTDQPLALTPGDGPDRDGCWSGVLVDDGGTPTLVYSGHRDGQERACLAVGDASLRSWTPLNEPVIAEPPPDLDLLAYRDHCVWREGETWHQIIGAGIAGRGGAALHHTSADLRTWHYTGVLVAADELPEGSPWTGTVWECVDLFPLGDRHVLVFSAWDAGVTHFSAYCWGSYADGRFTPESVHRLDHGLRHFYAPQTFSDPAGRRLAFGWAQEARSEQAVLRAGWSGALSLPRQLSEGPSGRLLQRPVEEVTRLRRHLHRVTPGPLVLGERAQLHPGPANQLDVELRVRLHDPATLVVLAVGCSPDEEEVTRLLLDASSGVLHLDRRRSSRDEDLDTVDLRCPLEVGPDGAVDLRVILDRSVLEIFTGGRALTARIYPTRADAVGVHVAVLAGRATLDQLDVWTMADCWTGPRPLCPENLLDAQDR